jgi:hypothetical protein
MSRLALALVAALALPAVALPAVAHAEENGPAGSIVELQVNHSTSLEYLKYHGYVVIAKGNQEAEYRWGGTACGSKTLPDSMVTMLQRALESDSTVIPRYELGQGQSQCLVGLTIEP